MAADPAAVFVDTAVIMYAGGSAHALRDPSRVVLDLTARGDLPGVTSAEVVREILHRFAGPNHRGIGERMAWAALDLFAPVRPVTHAVLSRCVELYGRYPGLAARDLVHAATCLHDGLPVIITPDRGFDAVPELRRVDPADTAGIHDLCR